MIHSTPNIKELVKEYKQYFDSSFFGIILMDLSGTVLEINSTMEGLIGYNKEDFISKNYMNIQFYPTKYIPMIRSRLEDIMQGKPLEPLELELQHKNGTIRWVRVITTPIKYNKNNLLLTIVQDIQQTKKQEKARNNFINRITHELKNPLTTISGAAQILKEVFQDTLKKEGTDLIHMILKGCERLDLLIQELLEIAKIESNIFKLNKQKSDISKLLEKTVDGFSYLIKERNINLKRHITPNLNLDIDATKIEQVFSNIISNAIKNTPPMGEIFIQLHLKEHCAYLEVKDTGIGIDKKDMDKLFKQFSRINRTDINADVISEGTGLGLYISKEIIDMHHGQIKVSSDGKNRGATFIVELPKNPN